MNKLIDLESIRKLVVSTIKENALTDEEIAECGAACGCGTTTGDLGAAVQYIGATKQDKEESALEEDEMEEMARGVIAPQEIAKREYVAEYPNSGIKTADQFLRKVINDPQAEGHDKYVKRLAFLLRNTDVKFFSNIAADISLDDEEDSNDNGLVSQYSNGLLNHRKGMSKASYDSKGTLNAYQRNVVKRGPYRKTLDMMQKPVTSLGMEISNKYNEVDPSESNKVLAAFFKSLEWNKLDNNKKLRELNAIENEADLDNIGFNILNKEKNNILDILASNEE